MAGLLWQSRTFDRTRAGDPCESDLSSPPTDIHLLAAIGSAAYVYAVPERGRFGRDQAETGELRRAWDQGRLVALYGQRRSFQRDFAAADVLGPCQTGGSDCFSVSG